MDLNEAIEKRASIRAYSDKKPKIDEIVKIILSANLAPSPGNLAILHWIIIDDYEKIEKIANACMQDWIKQAPFLVVFCSSPAKPDKLYDIRSNTYIKQHSGAAIQNFLLKVTEMGMASCWVGAYSDVMIQRILGIPDGIGIEAILPVGYQPKFDNTTQRTKSIIGERLFFNSFGNKFQTDFIKATRDYF